jgi:hypothetical protein
MRETLLPILKELEVLHGDKEKTSSLRSFIFALFIEVN